MTDGCRPYEALPEISMISISAILTAAVKELILLRRDRTGLLLLFVMPAVLVMVITLAQENVMELTGQNKTRLLILDLDQGELSRSLRQQLENARFEIVAWNGQHHNRHELQTAIADGDYRLGLVIPEGATADIEEHVARDLDGGGGQYGPERLLVPLFFDPGILPGLRSGLEAQLQMAFRTVTLTARLRQLESRLHGLAARIGGGEALAPLSAEGLGEFIDRPLFALEKGGSDKSAAEVAFFNPVQQNVCAWALFGMFFTAIPIAGAILQERNSGIWIRLGSLPVSHLELFGGKVAAYIGICLCQFLLIGLIGRLLFPAIGLPAFTVAGRIWPVLAVILFSSLAACGFGILLGMACSSYEQASTLGSTLVVAAAAIGGVMVPVYAMPTALQHISLVSPLNWELSALQDLLLRSRSFGAILADIGRLALFFLLTILLSWRLARSR